MPNPITQSATPFTSYNSRGGFAPSRDVSRDDDRTHLQSVSSGTKTIRHSTQHPDRLFFTDFSTWDRWAPALTHYRE
jgi:hypothetical protein